MKIKISPLVLVFGVILAFCGKIQLFLSYIAAMVLHEFAHAEVSRRLGYKLTQIKIMPYGAALYGKYDSLVARDEIEIAAVGPVCSGILWLGTVALWWLIPDLYFFTENFALANLSLALFNLLPAYPLDGGRILKAVLSLKTQKSYKITQIIGAIISLSFVLLAVWSWLTESGNPTLIITGAFMAVSAFIPDKKCKYERLYNLSYRLEKSLNCLPVKVFAVSKRTKIRKMLGKLSGEYFSVFTLIDMDNALIYETELDVITPNQRDFTVYELIKRKIS